MSQFKVYVLFPLLVIGLIYAGIKFYVHQSVAEEVDKAIEMARPFAHVSYQGIASDLRGSISVEGVEVRNPQQVMPVRIAEVRLEGPNTGFLFDLAGGFGRGRFPESMRMVLERIELPDMAELLPPGFSLDAGGGLPALQNREECSLGWLMQNIGMFKSDAYPLLLDMSSGYRFDIASGIAQLDFSYQVQSRERIEMEMYLSGVSQPGAVMLGVMPRVERLTLLYEPGRDHVTGLVNRCAQAVAVEPMLYVQDLLAQPDADLGAELGYVPGAGLRDALQRFLTDPRELRVEVGPLDDMLQLAAVEPSPAQMVSILDPRISVNGTPVTDLSFREASSTGRGDQDDAAAVQSGDEGAQAQGKRPRARMLPATVAELPDYLGRDVYIYTPSHERPVVGVLISIVNDEANVEKRMHGGSMTVHVPLKEITQVAVYRFPREGE